MLATEQLGWYNIENTTPQAKQRSKYDQPANQQSVIVSLVINAMGPPELLNAL
jgi:hypothetical protein